MPNRLRKHYYQEATPTEESPCSFGPKPKWRFSSPSSATGTPGGSGKTSIGSEHKGRHLRFVRGYLTNNSLRNKGSVRCCSAQRARSGGGHRSRREQKKDRCEPRSPALHARTAGPRSPFSRKASPVRAPVDKHRGGIISYIADDW